jgi:putative FmdB family regulatory protein
MPIYEYWCPKCRREFEQMRPMSKADEPAACPTCGTTSQKLPSVFASGSGYTIKVPAKDALRKWEEPQPAQTQA